MGVQDICSNRYLLLQIVKTLGYTNLMTYLIQAPPYVFAYLATLVVSWSSGRYLEHCWHIIGCTVACIIGIIMITTLNVAARYFGMFLLCAGPFVGLNVRIPVTVKYWSVLTVSDTHSLGNHERIKATDKTSSTYCYHQLHCFCVPLVFTLFLRKFVATC
jgi:hypothetical protein